MYSLLVVCALSIAFLLRFLLALVREGRGAARERVGEPRGSRLEREELFPMTLQTRNSNLKRGQSSGTKSAALLLVAMLLLTVAAAHPLFAEDASTAMPVESTSAQGGYSALPPDVAKQIEALTKRVEQLEQQLKGHEAAGQPITVVPSAKATAPQMLVTPAATPIASSTQNAAVATDSTKPAKIAPFSDWDWTWLNGNPRNKDVAFDSKFFTPEIRADVTYNYDFNKPVDNSIGGSSEIFRANEIQLEQLGLGGDFHYDNVRARFMTQFGMYSTTTVRNDPSYAKGQWNLNEAHRYLAEALRRLSHRRVERDQHRCGNFLVVYRLVQLLQLR